MIVLLNVFVTVIFQRYGLVDEAFNITSNETAGYGVGALAS